MTDPFEDLGLTSAASPEEIRKAYLRLAKKLHPDLNPGNKNAEERFKEVASANALLSDADKRKRFDSGEIDAAGNERPRERYYKDFASDAAPGDPYDNRSGYADFAHGGTDDIFAELFKRQARAERRAPGADLHFRLSVEFLDAVNGATKRLILPDGGKLDVTIPPGMQEGQTLRLRGKGALSSGEGPSGDALVEVSINPHQFFVRKGEDIYVDLPITLVEAVLGGEISAPTPAGPVILKVPKGSNTGTTLRLKGKGVLRPGGNGDEFVKLKVMLPTTSDPELEDFLGSWAIGHTYNPRRDMRS